MLKGRLLDYAFLILRLYLYVYLFIAVTLKTGPLSVCVAAATTIIYHPETVLSYFVSYNGILIPDSVQSVSWSLAEFRHNKIVQSPHENYFNVCRQHKEK